MADLIAEKEENPPDDLLGRQIVKLRGWHLPADGAGRHGLRAARGRP